MRNHPQTSNRRRFGFDLLEGRQLLSGAYFPAAQAEVVVITYGPPADSGGLSGHDARMDESGHSSTMDAPSWEGQGAGTYDRGGDADQGAMARMDGAAAAPSGGVDGTAASLPSSSTAPGSNALAPGGSSLTTPAADSLSGSAYGSPAGAASMAPDAAAAPGSSQAMLPSINAPAVPPGESPAPYGPGGIAMPGRFEDAPPASFMVISSPDSPAGPSAMVRGRSEPFEGVGSTTGPANTPGSPNAPGVQAMLSQATGLATSTTAAGAALQAVTGAPNLPVQPATLTDPDSSFADHAAPAVGPIQRSDARGAVQAGRLDSANGRSILATTLSHPGRMATADLNAALGDRDAASFLPRGADLIAEALPFAGVPLEQSLNEFVHQLEAVDMAGLVSGGPPPVVVVSLTILTAAASALAVREIVRRRSVRGRGVRMMDHLGRELALSFPELPRSWSERR